MRVPGFSLTAALCLLLGLVLAGCSSGGDGNGGGPDPDTTGYFIGGTISGLNGTVVLRSGAGNELSRSANGAFTFSTQLASGSSYAVTVLSQPVGQTCTVTNGSGTVGSSHVTSVTVICVDDAAGSGLSNANLASLILSNGTLAPTFAPDQLAYTSTQPFPVENLQLTLVPENSGATIRINGTVVASGQPSQPIALQAGASTAITIEVTAANGTTTRAYTVEIARQSASGFAQQAYIKASNPDGVAANPAGAGDQFGYTIAVSGDGNTLAVGALYESSNATGINGDQTNNLAAESGAVYVFTRSGNGTWSQQAYVKASNAEAYDGFANSIALSGDGNTLAVGAPKEDSAAIGIDGNQGDNNAINAGAVYVYTRSGSTWTQQAYVKASNTGATFDELDYFGWSVALSGDGNLLAVGAPGEGSNATGVNGNQLDNSARASGAVYVFGRDGVVWAQRAYLKASNTAAQDGMGSRIALSRDGSTLAAAAVGEDSDATGINGNQASNAASYSGAVYVFTQSGGVWSQQAYVKASNTGTDDEFGHALALSGDGNTLAVSARYESSAATGIGGDQTSEAAADSGAVYVFTRNAGEWSQQAYVKASNTNTSDNFGGAVAISDDGNRLAVSTIYEDGGTTGINGDASSNSAVNSGAVYVFGRSGSTWTQRAYVKASNAEAGDLFGSSVAMSGDADVLVVGAMGEDSNATGVNGNQASNAQPSSGAAYVFTGAGAD